VKRRTAHFSPRAQWNSGVDLVVQQAFNFSADGASAAGLPSVSRVSRMVKSPWRTAIAKGLLKQTGAS
jgi:hypothetical protein